MNIILYMLELTLILFLFHGVFALSNKLSMDFDKQRWFILTAIMTAIFIPFLPGMFETNSFSFEILLPQVTIGGAENALITAKPISQGISTVTIMFIIYLAVVFFMLARVVKSLIQISNFINKGRKESYGKQTIVYTDQITSPCSFFDYVFIPNAIINEEELETCINHEITHSQLFHSMDKIMMQLALAFLWWHPSVWYFAKQLDLVHEYQVDQRMTNEISKETYQKVLIKFLLYPTGLKISNPFSSNIKKRIIMMNNFELENKPLKSLGVFFALFFGILLIHACTEDQASIDQNLSEVKKANVEDRPDSYEVEVIDTITTFDGDTFEETVQVIKGTKKIYNVVDQMPIFPGCDEGLEGEALTQCSNQKLLNFIYNNIKYPKEAQEKDIEGMVLVKFVVNTDGTIGHREYLKTLGHGMEDTVGEMLDKMNREIRWEAGVHEGKEVNVAFTLPVKFKLEG